MRLTTRYDPELHRRRSVRLPGYDYAQAGAYFVTVCTQDRACLFGAIVDGEMRPNDAGAMVRTVWDGLPTHYPGVERDAFVVMPNHVHGIIALTGGEAEGDNAVGARSPRPSGRQTALPGYRGAADGSLRRAGRPRPYEVPSSEGVEAPQEMAGRHLTLGQVVAVFKYQSTTLINRERGTSGVRLWQRNYYEHVIRDDADLGRIREYVESNPARWELDQLHPDNPSRW